MKLLKLTIMGQELTLKAKKPDVRMETVRAHTGPQFRDFGYPSREKAMDDYFMLTNRLDLAVKLPDDFAEDLLKYFGFHWKSTVKAELLDGDICDDPED